MRILVVEDFGPIRGALVTALRDEGWSVDLAADGDAARALLDAGPPFDIVLLDLMIPGIDGMTLLRQMRGENNDCHVLVLTARDAIESRVEALNAGADDYLVKPFAMEELVARVRALLRRKYVKKSPTVRVGPLELETAGRKVTMDGHPVELTQREYALLEYFIFRAGDVITRDEVHGSLYGDVSSSASSNVVDVYVGYLRKKLEASGCPRILHTVRGAGYVLEDRPGTPEPGPE